MIYEDIGWIFLEWRRYHQRRLNRFGITIQQYSLMKKLQKEGTVCAREAAAHLHCDRPTLSVVIANLVKKGWMERNADAEDRRRCSLRLTEAGERMLSDIDDALPPVAGKPFDVLTEDQRRELAYLLSLGRKRLAEIVEEDMTDPEKGEENNPFD